ncbi:ankyrin repeat-containing domain protein [Mycena rosella]|uniref:Ankyrin repeat-containing domain protein n=1 Tax=Mycena rosella TaxID=1033263 RepID=A0AAD7GDY0_MYCRO|nr:ankyrin repeat-containing domain protein [Mycena rosella]
MTTYWYRTIRKLGRSACAPRHTDRSEPQMPNPCRGACVILTKPWQITSLLMYSLVLIPGFNLIPPFLFFLTLHISYNWSRGRHGTFWKWGDKALGPILKVCTLRGSQPSSDAEKGNPSQLSADPAVAPSDGSHPPPKSPPRNACLIVGLIFLVAFNILFIVDIELTLRRNKGGQNGDAEWGFGQVLALLLLVIPLRDTWGALKEIRENLKSIQGQFEELFLRECQATPAVKELEHLIKRGANVNIRTADPTFGSPLQLAAYYGKIELVEVLLNERDVIGDKADGGYGTPLQAASARGHVAVVEKLLADEKYKEGLNKIGGRYGTALCAACANEQVEVVKVLLQAGALLNVNGEQMGTNVP